jgi:hypothetical protein
MADGPGPGAADKEGRLPARQLKAYPLNASFKVDRMARDNRAFEHSSIRAMGFNRRKMEDQRRTVAEKEARG